MKINKIYNINKELDKWIISHRTNISKSLTFDFSYISNVWIKNTVKEITIESLIIKSLTIETLNRYNYNLKHFFDFLKEYNIEMKTFEKLTYQDTQNFIYYLKNKEMTNSTRVGVMASLKWLIQYGQTLEYEGFPTHQIFSGEEYRAVKVEDVLKTKYIPDNVMEKIELALLKEENKMLKNIIEIGIDTGLRIGEVLDLEIDCLTEDLAGKPLLKVNSIKNKTIRRIPVSIRVKRAILSLIELSNEGRKALNSLNITIYWLKRGRPARYDRLTQSNFRGMLRRFVKRHKILDENGEFYNLTYHGFRHTLGTEMLNNGMTMEEIAQYLGHESLHSTAGYAKVQNPIIQKEYKKVGFIGKIVESTSNLSVNVDEKLIESASLPDGTCAKPIDSKGNTCMNFNMCLLCPKFITTPDHLQTHKNHLDRIQKDKDSYMKSEYIGTLDHLEKIESSLKEIILQLEGMHYG